MDTLQVPEHSTSISNYYRWEVPGRKVTVLLDFDVVDRMLLEVMRGFGAIPRRGAEVGGILVGTADIGVDRTIVHVRDFEPVVCEHRRGPSYTLSDADTTRYEETLARLRYSPEKPVYAVGCYRSHTRDGLGLAPEDLKHYDSYFPDPSSVFLLIKPYATRVSMAGFFFREEGGYVQLESSYQEFPFRRKDLGGGASPARPRETGMPVSPPPSTGRLPTFAGPPEPAAGDQMFYEEESEAQEQLAQLAQQVSAVNTATPLADHPDAPLGKFRRTNVWVPLSFIFLLLGVAVGFQAAMAYKPLRPASVLAESYHLSMAVSRAGDNIHVRWNRQAQAVRTAQRGVLTITDGTYSTTVDLDSAQLQNPSVFYRNMSSVVLLKLEVFTSDRTSVSETLEWRK